MKRLTPRRRAHFVRRASYELSRRARRRRPDFRPGVHPVVVKFVGDLDLIDNAEETRGQFARLENLERRGRGQRRRKLFIDLEQVTSLEACALVYLVAMVDYVGKDAGVRVVGNYPRAPAALKAMIDARFHEFMGMRARKAASRSVGKQRGLYLKRGSSTETLDPKYWTTLPRFLREHGALSADDADAFYNAFGECVENVRHHAYGRVGGNWYAAAICPAQDKPARAVILDLGVGIPHTIRRTPQDLIRQMVAIIAESLKAALRLANLADDEMEGVLDRAATDDWTCILLATLGLRTQTDQAGRGTGLNWLRETVRERGRGALHVLSGEGCVTWRYEEQPMPARLPALMGTIVCLEIEREPSSSTEAR